MHVDHGLDTEHAGIRCREVLAELSDYLDGDLPAARVAALQAHLSRCARCARFGGSVAGVLTALRAGVAQPATGERASDAAGDALLAAVLHRIGGR
jgi:anti-sigma factor RsiW